MCPECGAGDGYAHHDWCPVHKENIAKQSERARSKMAVDEASKMVRIEVLSEIRGWLNARMADDKKSQLPSVYLSHALLEYLESIKKR